MQSGPRLQKQQIFSATGMLNGIFQVFPSSAYGTEIMSDERTDATRTDSGDFIIARH